MHIADYDYLLSTSRIQQNSLNIRPETDNQADKVAGASQVQQAGVSSYNNLVAQPEKEQEEGVSLKISASSAAKAENKAASAGSFAPVNFSTDGAQEPSVTVSDNSVLNQYRFFVQSNQYEGADGVVKRVFR